MRRTFKPIFSRPDDFEPFWNSTRMQLERVDPRIEQAPLDADESPLIEGRSLRFESLGHARIGAYFLRWKDGRDRPLVVHSHGYGGQCVPRWDWAESGFNVLGVDVRGCGLSRDALPNRSRWGYVLTGVESPETSVLRLAVCDYMQTVRVGRMLLGDRISRLVLHGVSFAGGLATMSEAVLGAADLLVVGVPTFGWAEGRNFFVKSGSGAEISAYLDLRPEFMEDVMLVLSYFDTVSFAAWVECPALVGLGLKDDVVPAKTVYAIANHLTGPHEIMEFPVSHSDRPEHQLWKRFEAYWMKLATHGVPADFGEVRIAHPWDD